MARPTAQPGRMVRSGTDNQKLSPPMKSAFAAKLLADLRECPALYPYDGTDAEPPIPRLLAARVTAVRIDTAAMLWDFRFVRVPTKEMK